MRVTLFAMLALWSASGAAQTLYKCLDGRQRITYSDLTCEKQGLKDAGPIAERVTSMPFTPARKPAPRAADPAVASPAAGDQPDAGRGPAQGKSVDPVVNPLLK